VRNTQHIPYLLKHLSDESTQIGRTRGVLEALITDTSTKCTLFINSIEKDLVSLLGKTLDDNERCMVSQTLDPAMRGAEDEAISKLRSRVVIRLKNNLDKIERLGDIIGAHVNLLLVGFMERKVTEDRCRDEIEELRDWMRSVKLLENNFQQEGRGAEDKIALLACLQDQLKDLTEQARDLSGWTTSVMENIHVST
jgi:hypothetical protein